MEVLGFSDAASTWSDNPARPTPPIPETVPSVDDLFEGWEAGEVGPGLQRSNIRWGLMVFLGVVLGSMAYLGLWLYERPQVAAAAAVVSLEAAAEDLATRLDDVESFNQALPLPAPGVTSSDLDDVERSARALFEASASLPAAEAELRRLATSAAGAALDAVGQARDALGYRLAVSPLLVPPGLETDPELIALDEAARQFGEWQLGFDQIRSALPAGPLPKVTEAMESLSLDLAGMLGDYIDALRADDPAATQQVVAQLADRLDLLTELLAQEIGLAQQRIADRVAEARQALDAIRG